LQDQFCEQTQYRLWFQSFTPTDASASRPAQSLRAATRPQQEGACGTSGSGQHKERTLYLHDIEEIKHMLWFNARM